MYENSYTYPPQRDYTLYHSYLTFTSRLLVLSVLPLIFREKLPGGPTFLQREIFFDSNDLFCELCLIFGPNQSKIGSFLTH